MIISLLPKFKFGRLGCDTRDRRRASVTSVTSVTSTLALAVVAEPAFVSNPIERLYACLCASLAVETKKFGWLYVFAIVAIVLNPVAPLRLKRETWGIVDAAAAVLLLPSIAVMDIRRSRP